ncbi:hypothetical protein [Streptacidiphilus neutrinimicus]|uniref:hypothetical protein n=1 Tax=Streptacidiphilus neutrinimicus TaxID=105420 RepID=UPI0005A7CFA5|nr:hypothetical protein [Streptacidiphilus neutrinimicus]
MAESRDDLPLWLVTIPFRRPRDRRKGEQTFRVRAASARDARTEAWRLAQRPAALAHRRGAALIPTGPLLLRAERIPD